MSLFIWKPEYSVNDKTLDGHHQQLCNIVNSVYENVMSSQELDSVLTKVDELSEYTNIHFKEEERHMREMNFSGIDDHISKHKEFSHTLTTLQENYHNNDLEVARDLIIVLGNWLLNHVLKEDRKYSGLPIDLK